MVSVFKPTVYEITYKSPTTGNLKQLGNKQVHSKNFLAKLRKFGSFMAGMVIPAIGVLIAWGLFTAIILGVKTGIAYQNNIPIDQWTDADSIKYLYGMDRVIGFGILFVIPLIMSFLGGRQIYGWRGALIGLVSTLGVISYSMIQLDRNATRISEITNPWTFNAILVQITGDINLINTSTSPMIFGALICGPLFAYLFKQFERLYKDKVRQGFEMLVNNFSLGIFGCAAIFVSFWGIGPMMALLQIIFFFIVRGINDAKLLFILPIFIELEKVLFLNNAVNHGILGPLGYQEVARIGYSPLFYLDPNPGQGLGLLLAYIVLGTKEEKAQATAATPIHFIGGIHEVYYPFILMRPLNLLFMMAGGVFAGAIYQIFDFGGIFTPSPGSVIMNYLAVYSSKPLNYLALTIAIFGSTAIVFTLTSISLLWKNIRTGERIIFSPTKLRLIARIYRSEQFDLAKDINITKKIKTIDYEKVTDEHNYLWEIITLKDGSKEYFPIRDNDKRIVSFRYKEYQKDNGLKEKYLEKYYDKPGFNPSIKEQKYQEKVKAWSLQIDHLSTQYNARIDEINQWKNDLLSKINPQDTFSIENVDLDYNLKIADADYKFMRQIDLLKFKIKRTKHSDAKRVKVPIEENEIKAVDYLQKQMEFYKRTIRFVDSIKQKDLDKSTVEQLKTQLATQISAIRSTDPTDRKIREDNLTAETDEKIIQLTKVEVDGKWINKPYYKDQIDFVPITSTKETLESINLKDDLSSTSTNNELRNYVAKAKKVMFACEAGMGSSAMGAGMIKKMINNLGVKGVEVANCAIKDLPNDIDIIVTQKTFVDYVSKKYKNSYVYGVNQYLKKDEYKELIDTFKQERLA